MTLLDRLKVKVTIQGHSIYPSICVHSISPKLFERVSFNFIQMFLLVRQCAEHMTPPNWLKVKITGQGQGSILEFGVYSISPEPRGQFFMKLHLTVPLSEMMYRILELATKTQGQGHTSRSCALPFNLFLLHISILIRLDPNVPLS